MNLLKIVVVTVLTLGSVAQAEETKEIELGLGFIGMRCEGTDNAMACMLPFPTAETKTITLTKWEDSPEYDHWEGSIHEDKDFGDGLKYGYFVNVFHEEDFATGSSSYYFNSYIYDPVAQRSLASMSFKVGSLADLDSMTLNGPERRFKKDQTFTPMLQIQEKGDEWEIDPGPMPTPTPIPYPDPTP